MNKPSEYMERVERDIEETFDRVARRIEGGSPVVKAINHEAFTTESYNACLKKYNLRAVIPD